MSALAKKLAPVEPPAKKTFQPGPSGACRVYGEGDLEDWAEVERIRLDSTWMEAQRIVDEKLGFTTHIDNDTFRRHWRRRCAHWSDDLK